MAPSNDKDKRFLRKYVKLLSVTNNKNTTRNLIKAAPIPVLKLLSNAAILTSKAGNINLSDNQKQVFRKKRKFFSILGNHSISFDKKRKYLVQRGGAAFIPILLSTVLPIVADVLFNAIGKK